MALPHARMRVFGRCGLRHALIGSFGSCTRGRARCRGGALAPKPGLNWEGMVSGTRWRRPWGVTAVMVATAGVLVTAAYGAAVPSWSMSGQGITNWRYQADENKINAKNAGALTAKWATQLGGDISATPAVVDGVAYVPDWGGKLSAVDTKTGAIIWQKSVGAHGGRHRFADRRGR